MPKYRELAQHLMIKCQKNTKHADPFSSRQLIITIQATAASLSFADTLFVYILGMGLGNNN